MADLSALIRLHKHELDEKRRALGELYEAMSRLDRALRDLEIEFERERDSASIGGEVHFTFANYAEMVRMKKMNIVKQQEELERHIEKAKESLMETFGELKKYQMTQAERDRLEEEERRFKDARTMDEIGLEGFRRKTDGGES